MSVDIPSGLIDFYLHPPIGRLEPRLDTLGPYSGNRTISQWSSTLPPVTTPTPVSASYGVIVQLEGALPPDWSFSQGWVSDDGQYEESIYYPSIAQLAVQHQFPNGGWVTSQLVDVNRFPMMVTWTESLPGRLGLLVAPHLSVDLLFLVRSGAPVVSQ